MQHHETASAKVAAAGIDHGLRISGSDGGVDRVAACAKDFRTHFGGQTLRRYHDAMLCLHCNGRGGVRADDPGKRNAAWIVFRKNFPTDAPTANCIGYFRMQREEVVSTTIPFSAIGSVCCKAVSRTPTGTFRPSRV